MFKYYFAYWGQGKTDPIFSSNVSDNVSQTEALL